jgi:hypothetical protein
MSAHLPVQSGPTPPCFGFVYDVVVDERREMEKLDRRRDKVQLVRKLFAPSAGARLSETALGGFACNTGAEQSESRPKHFARPVQQFVYIVSDVGTRIGDRLESDGPDAPQVLIDPRQSVPE